MTSTSNFKCACVGLLKPLGSKKTTMKSADVKDTPAKETGTHAAQCHHMVGELCPHGEVLNLVVDRLGGE